MVAFCKEFQLRHENEQDSIIGGLAMPKGSTTQADVLAALLSGTDPSYRSGSNLFIALHTASPAGGDQTTNEVTTTAYVSYTRYTLAKSGAWTPSGSTYSNAATITFASCTGGTSPIVTYYSIGVGSATPAAASQMLYYGPLSTPVTVTNGQAPAFAGGTLQISEV